MVVGHQRQTAANLTTLSEGEAQENDSQLVTASEEDEEEEENYARNPQSNTFPPRTGQ